MNHVILPRPPSHHKSIEVPLLTRIDYNGNEFKDFKAYPEQQAWGEREIGQWEAIFASRPPKFLEFLQRWLFFGTLQTAFGNLVPVLIRDFTRSSCEPRVVTTVKLPILIAEFRDRVRAVDPKDIWEHIIRVYDVQSFVSGLLSALHPDNLEKVKSLDSEGLANRSTLTGYILGRFATDPMDQYISISIHLISELLPALLPSLNPRTNLSRAVRTKFSPGTGPLWDMLEKKGWCPSDMLVLFRQFNTSGLLFLNSLAPPEPPSHYQTKFTQKLSNDASHKTCGSLGCTVRQIPDANYKRRHFRDCRSDCGDFKAAPNEILERGNIPLIRCIDENDESGKIHLVGAVPTSRYVAISHVWSDGLGNPVENSIPRCQLLNLGSLVQKLPEDCAGIHLFWLDTICVPPDASNQPEAQQIALQKMRQTYEEASAVLVLDSWLLSNKLESDSDLDNLTRIFVSTWNRRLWTFQEGFFAKQLYFQFVNGVYELGQGMDRLERCDDLILDLTLKPTLNAQYIALRGSTRYTNARNPLNMLAVWRTARFRSTSVRSDEALCLAAIVGFDTKKIANIQDADENTKHTLRMQTFWKMAMKVPRDLVFYEGKTLPYPGFRWAPYTLLRSKSNNMAIEDIISAANTYTMMQESGIKRVDQGLLINASGLIFSPEATPLLGELYLVDDCAQYTILPHLPEVLGLKDGTNLKGLLRPSIDPPPMLVAFISDGTMEGVSDTDYTHRGILACINEEKNGIIFVRKICNAHSLRDRPNLVRKGSCKNLKAERKLADQSWCVD